MRNLFTAALILITSISIAQQKVVGYVYTTSNVASVDWTKITHLNLAFENPDAAGNLSYGSNNDAFVQKAHENGVKILVSICGGAASNDDVMRARYFNLISDANRTAFVAKIIQYLDDHNLDGIDLDLEGPAINSDYDKFVASLDDALPNGMLITAALSHLNNGDAVSAVSIERLDFLNIMAYDQTGPWNPGSPGQHSSYEFALESLEWWEEHKNLDRFQAILGVPFYGYGFGADANEGISYSEILSRFGSGAEDRDVSGNTIYYNGIPTIRKKTKYVVDEGYGGIMIWQLGHDVSASNPNSLLRNIYQEINGVTAIEKQEEQVFTISPNPASKFIELSVANRNYLNADVIIMDATGRILLTLHKPHQPIDVSSLSGGMYIVHFQSGHNSFVGKFLKQ